MKKTLLMACALCVGATTVQAGGLDRSGQGTNILFEEGSVVQFRLGYTSPAVSGTMLNNLGQSVSSGDIANSFFTPHLAYKTTLTEDLDFALIYDQPFGADITYAPDYPLSTNRIPLGRTDVLRATADTDALTAFLRFKIEGGFSAIGGIRGQRIKANAAVPLPQGYRLETDEDIGFGYVAGIAWERPEIAARVALTYNSKISHNLSQTESYNPRPSQTVPLGTVETFETESEIESPQSVNLDFQTGVAPRTLLFGSVRWADWPQLVYGPPYYPPHAPQTANLVDYDDDTFTYSLGLGYRFTDEFSGAVTLGYEASTGEPVSNLGPTDGFWSVGLGGTYSLEKAKITGGMRYTDIGDATAKGADSRGNNPNLRATFSGNTAWSVGIQITYALD